MNEPKHRPRKKWGQNFLRNQGAVRKIVDALDAPPDELVLEIGPGEGALTRRLAELRNPLRVIEIDPDLAAKISAELGARIDVVEGDATTVDLPTVPFTAVGNLPYNVGTPILRRVVRSEALRRAVFMLQKEVADRITAAPGEESYGFLTLAVRIYADARRLMILEPSSFHPRPKVRSAVVVIDRLERRLETPPQELEGLISTSFRMPRKKLLNNLIGYRELDRTRAAAAIEQAGLPPDCRADRVSLDQFDRLGSVIASFRDVSPLPRP
ncbi:MAG: 16S rRNA (adenine(1518)-N(6)/adenine(1519)-N(6))-dimethyltransferase RsmA [Thermoanaerobaculia bacterium]